MKQKKHEEFCVVCSARNRTRFQDTCDAICTRANYAGKTRGRQIELEIRAEWRKPIPEPRKSNRDILEETNYNRPYMIDRI